MPGTGYDDDAMRVDLSSGVRPPVHVGDVVCAYADLIRVGTTSIGRE